MPDYNGSIILVRGNVIRVNRTVTSLPGTVSAPQTATKAWLTVKTNKSDLDAAAIFQLEITTSATAAGQLTDADGTDGSAVTAFVISKTQSELLVADTLYHYSIKVLMSSGEPYTPEMGRLLAKRDSTIIGA